MNRIIVVLILIHLLMVDCYMKSQNHQTKRKVLLIHVSKEAIDNSAHKFRFFWTDSFFRFTRYDPQAFGDLPILKLSTDTDESVGWGKLKTLSPSHGRLEGVRVDPILTQDLPSDNELNTDTLLFFETKNLVMQVEKFGRTHDNLVGYMEDLEHSIIKRAFYKHLYSTHCVGIKKLVNQPKTIFLNNVFVRKIHNIVKDYMQEHIYVKFKYDLTWPQQKPAHMFTEAGLADIQVYFNRTLLQLMEISLGREDDTCSSWKRSVVKTHQHFSVLLNRYLNYLEKEDQAILELFTQIHLVQFLYGARRRMGGLAQLRQIYSYYQKTMVFEKQVTAEQAADQVLYLLKATSDVNVVKEYEENMKFIEWQWYDLENYRNSMSSTIKDKLDFFRKISNSQTGVSNKMPIARLDHNPKESPVSSDSISGSQVVARLDQNPKKSPISSEIIVSKDTVATISSLVPKESFVKSDNYTKEQITVKNNDKVVSNISLDNTKVFNILDLESDISNISERTVIPLWPESPIQRRRRTTEESWIPASGSADSSISSRLISPVPSYATLSTENSIISRISKIDIIDDFKISGAGTSRPIRPYKALPRKPSKDILVTVVGPGKTLNTKSEQVVVKAKGKAPVTGITSHVNKALPKKPSKDFTPLEEFNSKTVKPAQAKRPMGKRIHKLPSIHFERTPLLPEEYLTNRNQK